LLYLKDIVVINAHSSHDQKRQMQREIVKVLIITKEATFRGGVGNYFRLFFKKYEDIEIKIERSDIGSRLKDYQHRKRRRLSYLLDFIRDFFRIFWKLNANNSIRIVQLNPSLIPVPLIRDGIILLLSKMLGRKVIVFFRGWDENIVHTLSTRGYVRRLFYFIFCRADATIVLAEDFLKPLLDWGFDPKQLHVSKTMFDGEQIKLFHPSDSPTIKFLFLSRISKEKGIYEIIEAARILRNQGMTFKLNIHGYFANTEDKQVLQQNLKENELEAFVCFGNYLDVPEKYEVFADHDVFLLPSYQEGCPNAVLEAMASGCFVICTEVGALKEIVLEGVNGRLVQVKNAIDLAEKMAWTIRNIDKARELGRQNVKYAFEHFESKPIIGQITKIYQTLIQAE
jgi:glycosyltransferase involved in cell wall biosynthesis